MKKEDPEILVLFASDEEKAFRLVFEKYYVPLCAVARLYVHNRAEAEDIIQQLMIKLWEDKQFLQVKSSLRGYLQQSVRNQCLNHLEKKKSLSEKIRKIPDPESVGHALDFLLDVEARTIVEKAVEDLPRQGRKTLEAVYFSGQSYKEAANSLNLSLNTVKSHLKNALRHLRDNPTISAYYKKNGG
jgi:RNA polymerase sigma-70 factor (ECF subfamily)